LIEIHKRLSIWFFAGVVSLTIPTYGFSRTPVTPGQAAVEIGKKLLGGSNKAILKKKRLRNAKRRKKNRITSRSGQNRFLDHNGRKVVNSKFANKTFPLKNINPILAQKYRYPIKFNKYGYPDFEKYTRQTVSSSKLTGKDSDFSLANNEMRKRIPGWKKPPNTTWHHHQSCKFMQLVPMDLHDAVRHSGGASRLKDGVCAN
jgi:hypothetical protein